MSPVGGKMDASKLAPWIGVVMTAAVAGGTVLAASNFRIGADQVTLDEHTRQIAQIQVDARLDHDAETKAVVQIEQATQEAKEAKDAASRASVTSQQIETKISALLATVDDLKSDVGRLVARLDRDPLPGKSPSP